MRELRFAVVAADGRRSSVWRVWTQADEAYLATRSMAGQVKISLHASGYCQHGLTQRVRDLMPLGEQAFDRWYQPQGQPGVLEPAYQIYFPGSELLLQQEPPPPSASLIPLSTDEHEVSVGVFKVRMPLPPAEDDLFLRHLARSCATVMPSTSPGSSCPSYEAALRRPGGCSTTHRRSRSFQRPSPRSATTPTASVSTRLAHPGPASAG